MKANFEKGTKVCSSSKCAWKKQEQPISNFVKDTYQVDGLKSECQTCSHKRDVLAYEMNVEEIKRRSAQWKLDNPDKVLGHRYSQKVSGSLESSRLKYLYGITLDQKKQMLIQQNSKCAICQKPVDISVSVDHNHISKLVRGLLCQPCNTLIGMAQESTTILNNAIKYLKKYETLNQNEKRH